MLVEETVVELVFVLVLDITIRLDMWRRELLRRENGCGELLSRPRRSLLCLYHYNYSSCLFPALTFSKVPPPPFLLPTMSTNFAPFLVPFSFLFYFTYWILLSLIYKCMTIHTAFLFSFSNKLNRIVNIERYVIFSITSFLLNVYIY